MGATPDPETEKAFDGVPSSFLEGDDDEMITIDFDQLKKQISGALGASPLLSTPEMPQETPESQPMMENFEITEEELEETYEAGGKDPVISRSNHKKVDALSEESVEEDVLLKKKEVLKKKHAGKPAETGEEEEEEMEELEETFSLEESEEELEENIHVSIGNSEEEQEEEWELEEDLAADAANLGVAEENIGKAAAAKGVAARKYFSSVASEKESGLGKLSSPTPTKKMEEDLQITEEELAELQEYLEVDIKPMRQTRGYMGTTGTERKLADNADKAAARDARAAKKREEEMAAMGDLKDKLEESLKENTELQEKMIEMAGFLDTLKENVEKLSISNAKLLYTNKVLGNASLNERQKEQIVETISKSTSVLEAKTIYNTLQSTVSAVSEGKKAKESLSEALIRGNSPFITRKQQTADDTFAERMKALAGISNKS
jgi:hypothetical protein